MLASGCGVLAIVNLDSETGSAVIAKATAAGKKAVSRAAASPKKGKR